MKARFAKLVRKMVAIGTNAPHLSANTPCRPDCIPRVVDPGYVRARAAGRAVCRPKYTGKSFCWSWENWGLGKAW